MIGPRLVTGSHPNCIVTDINADDPDPSSEYMISEYMILLSGWLCSRFQGVLRGQHRSSYWQHEHCRASPEAPGAGQAQELNEAQLANLTCLTDSEVESVTEEVEAVKRQTEQERARHQQAHSCVTPMSTQNHRAHLPGQCQVGCRYWLCTLSLHPIVSLIPPLMLHTGRHYGLWPLY